MTKNKKKRSIRRKFRKAAEEIEYGGLMKDVSRELDKITKPKRRRKRR